jgi:hypothetical protein
LCIRQFQDFISCQSSTALSNINSCHGGIILQPCSPVR